MRIEVYNSNWAIGFVHAAQQGQRDRVVTPHGDHPGESLALLRQTRKTCICSGLTHENTVVSFFNLLNSPGGIVRGDWDIATVEHLGPAVERVGGERDVVTSAAKHGSISKSMIHSC